MRLFNSRYGLVSKRISVQPTKKIMVQSSKNARRRIAVHVHKPPEDCNAVKRLRERQRALAKLEGLPTLPHHTPRPLPVHINLHGSGFTLPNHGEDAEPCEYLARTVPCTVLDATYALSPEHKLPTPIHDILDIIRYVLANPHLYDVERITIGGVSAGATAAILAANYTRTYEKDHFPKDVVKSVVAWCPITDFSYSMEDRRVTQLPKGAPGVPIEGVIRLFVDSCLREGEELQGSRVSPMYADPEAFPPTLFIVRKHISNIPRRALLIFLLAHMQIGTSDPLHPDSLHLHNRLSHAGTNSELIEVHNASHAFDRCLKLDGSHSKQWAATWYAYERIVKRLREAYGWGDVGMGSKEED
jgi:acetyl esterase/lipase